MATTLLIRNGILKILETEEEKKELAKNNFDYRLTTAGGEYTLIDYDKDSARMYVKALLAKVNKLKEVKLLYAVIIILIIAVLSSIAFGTLALVEIGNVKKLIAAVPQQKAQEMPAAKPAPVPVNLSEIRRNIDNSDNLDNMTKNTASGAVNTQKSKF